MSFDEAQMYCPHCARNVLGRRPATHHMLHLIATLLTCGVWFIGWMLVSVYEDAQPYRCPSCGAAGPKPRSSLVFIVGGLLAVLGVLPLLIVGAVLLDAHWQAGQTRQLAQSQHAADEALRAKRGLQQQHCDAGEMEACYELALAYEKGEGVASDIEKSIVLLKKACDKRHARACLALARTHYRANSGSAAPFLEIACEEKSGDACLELAQLRGNLDPRAASLYERACKYGARLGCRLAARAYDAGPPFGPKDPTKALALLDANCSTGEAQDCESVAEMYDAGQGIAKDATKAGEYRKKARELRARPTAR